MFEIIYLLFSWLPPPLNAIVFGGICLLLVFAIIGVVAKFIDMLPFT